jgi:hypothetical protein
MACSRFFPPAPKRDFLLHLNMNMCVNSFAGWPGILIGDL